MLQDCYLIEALHMFGASGVFSFRNTSSKQSYRLPQDCSNLADGFKLDTKLVNAVLQSAEGGNLGFPIIGHTVHSVQANTPQNVACPKTLRELLEFRPLQLRGQLQCCWQSFPFSQFPRVPRSYRYCVCCLSPTSNVNILISHTCCGDTSNK